MAKILLIEDDKFQQKALVDKFQKEGFEIIQAFDGKEGIARAIKDKPDFILLDLIMPVMNGTATLRQLKEHPETKDIPVALLTVVPQDLSWQPDDKNIHEETVGFWEKDKISIEEIVKNVKDFLEKR